MNYTGTIFGLRAKNGTIYNISLDDENTYVWRASVNAEYDGNFLNIRFTWNREKYTISLRRVKPNYFTGKILFNESLDFGEGYFWAYGYQNDLILRGNYTENTNDDYDCFIQLNHEN
jgi:hypothetical protein